MHPLHLLRMRLCSGGELHLRVLLVRVLHLRVLLLN
jgi:hypothetical protein